MAEDIHRDPSQVELIKDRGQVIFIWTDDKTDSATVKSLKELGADGIVYDRYLSYTFVSFMSFR
jgi:glycerophosphoryl diester phosphodiesterase